MNNDLTFRIAVVVLLVLMKVVRWPSRHLIGWHASWPAMKKNPLDATILMLCGLAWFVALVAYVFFPQHIASFGVELPAWLRWTGVMLAVAALFLLGWADYSLGSNLSVIVQIKENQTLITSGPYRWVRHPMYTSALVFSASFFLVSANWFVGLCYLGPMAVLCASRIPEEEKLMLGKFGDRYRRYMKRSGRLLPRIRRSSKTAQAADDSQEP